MLTNECKLNHTQQQQLQMQQPQLIATADGSYTLLQQQQSVQTTVSTQEDETYYTRELIHIYGQPIVPSFHKHFNYQLSNTHYGYRTLRRLLNCDILKKYVKITKEEIKSLDRVVEFVQLTSDKCLDAFKLNMATFYDPKRFQNGIVKDWLDTWYVQRLKEMYAMNDTSRELLSSPTPTSTSTSPSISFGSSSTWSPPNSASNTTSQSSNAIDATYFLQLSHSDFENIECDQSNHLWFCLQDYGCKRMDELMHKLNDYVTVRNNKSELILVHTIHPKFEYKDVLSEARRILAVCLGKTMVNINLDEIMSSNIPVIARQYVESLLCKYLNVSSSR